MTAKIKIFDNGDSRFNCRNVSNDSFQSSERGKERFHNDCYCRAGGKTGILKIRNFRSFRFSNSSFASLRGEI
jgi:hypothetical protein